VIEVFVIVATRMNFGAVWSPTSRTLDQIQLRVITWPPSMYPRAIAAPAGRRPTSRRRARRPGMVCVRRLRHSRRTMPRQAKNSGVHTPCPGRASPATRRGAASRWSSDGTWVHGWCQVMTGAESDLCRDVGDHTRAEVSSWVATITKHLYHNSTLALNADTGKIVWYYQHIVDPLGSRPSV